MLHINPDAYVVAAKASEGAAAAQLQAEPPALSVAAANTFDAATTAAMAWARLLDDALAAEAHGGDRAVGAESAIGFASLDAMNEQNAVHLSATRQPL